MFSPGSTLNKKRSGQGDESRQRKRSEAHWSLDNKFNTHNLSLNKIFSKNQHPAFTGLLRRYGLLSQRATHPKPFFIKMKENETDTRFTCGYGFFKKLYVLSINILSAVPIRIGTPPSHASPIPEEKKVS
jgi:hypothetical protein